MAAGLIERHEARQLSRHETAFQDYYRMLDAEVVVGELDVGTPVAASVAWSPSPVGVAAITVRHRCVAH